MKLERRGRDHSKATGLENNNRLSDVVETALITENDAIKVKPSKRKIAMSPTPSPQPSEASQTAKDKTADRIEKDPSTTTQEVPCASCAKAKAPCKWSKNYSNCARCTRGGLPHCDKNPAPRTNKKRKREAPEDAELHYLLRDLEGIHQDLKEAAFDGFFDRRLQRAIASLRDYVERE